MKFEFRRILNLSIATYLWGKNSAFFEIGSFRCLLFTLQNFQGEKSSCSAFGCSPKMSLPQAVDEDGCVIQSSNCWGSPTHDELGQLRSDGVLSFLPCTPSDLSWPSSSWVGDPQQLDDRMTHPSSSTPWGRLRLGENHLNKSWQLELPPCAFSESLAKWFQKRQFQTNKLLQEKEKWRSSGSSKFFFEFREYVPSSKRISWFKPLICSKNASAMAATSTLVNMFWWKLHNLKIHRCRRHHIRISSNTSRNKTKSQPSQTSPTHLQT
jgi:hypothetical protein